MKQTGIWIEKLGNLAGKTSFWFKLELGKILRIRVEAGMERNKTPKIDNIQ